MDRILYSSPHIPKQWIAAHRLEPVLLRPSYRRAQEYFGRTEGVCTYAQAWIGEALADRDAAGIVLAQTCDQARRLFEVLQDRSRVPCFLFNIPATWQSVQANKLYRAEIGRLGRFLINVGGREPTAEALAEEMVRSEPPIEPDSGGKRSWKIPLALAGPHTVEEDAVWMEMIEGSGGRIVSDCAREQPSSFDRRNLAGSPFSELADGCFNAIRDIFQRPNSGFYQKLERALKQNEVKGLVIRRYLWCDLWHAEVYRIKQWSPVPVLDLEISGDPKEDSHRLATRIQSFMEMIA